MINSFSILYHAAMQSGYRRTSCAYCQSFPFRGFTRVLGKLGWKLSDEGCLKRGVQRVRGAWAGIVCFRTLTHIMYTDIDTDTHTHVQTRALITKKVNSLPSVSGVSRTIIWIPGKTNLAAWKLQRLFRRHLFFLSFFPWPVFFQERPQQTRYIFSRRGDNFSPLSVTYFPDERVGTGPGNTSFTPTQHHYPANTTVTHPLYLSQCQHNNTCTTCTVWHRTSYHRDKVKP